MWFLNYNWMYNYLGAFNSTWGIQKIRKMKWKYLERRKINNKKSFINNLFV